MQKSLGTLMTCHWAIGTGTHPCVCSLRRAAAMADAGDGDVEFDAANAGEGVGSNAEAVGDAGIAAAEEAAEEKEGEAEGEAEAGGADEGPYAHLTSTALRDEVRLPTGFPFLWRAFPPPLP